MCRVLQLQSYSPTYLMLYFGVLKARDHVLFIFIIKKHIASNCNYIASNLQQKSEKYANKINRVGGWVEIGQRGK